MTPIVNGLQAEFIGDVLFVYFNATDQAQGERAFRQSGLPGHPSYVIFQPDGHELYRQIGVVEEQVLREAILTSLHQVSTVGN
jgi:hypothetical protein